VPDPGFEQVEIKGMPTVREQIDMINALAEAAIVAERIDPEISGKQCAAALARACDLVTKPILRIETGK